MRGDATWQFEHDGRPVSKGEVTRLGQRLAAGPLTRDDEAVFQSFTEYAAEALDIVTARLHEHGIAAIERLKNRNTIREKLLREGFDLPKVQDLAGCRIVLSPDQGRFVQAAASSAIAQWMGPMPVRVRDRVAEPSQGYRAIHLLVKVRGVEVEIQIRTARQHAWAEVYEKLGDLMGRGIRYGEGVDAERVPPGLVDRAESLVTIAHTLAENIDGVERLFHRLDAVIAGGRRASRPTRSTGAARSARGVARRRSRDVP